MILATLIGIHYPTKGNLPVIVMEKMQFSLSKFVDSCNIIQWDVKLSILDDVCCGLHYLHSRNPPIIHWDLTPNNILLCSHLRAKITDLGVARTLQATDTKLTKAPTNDFLPPECAADNPVYGLPLDMFSFGGIILYICLQQWPKVTFRNDVVQLASIGIKVLTELEQRQQYLDDMFGDNRSLKPLAKSCLNGNPNDRPLAEEALMELKWVRDNKIFVTVSAGEELLQHQQEQPQTLYQIVDLERQKLQVSSDICIGYNTGKNALPDICTRHQGCAAPEGKCIYTVSGKAQAPVL